MVGSSGTWKVGLLRDDEVGYSTEEIYKKEACFYRFLDTFMCLISNFIFCKKFDQGTVKTLEASRRGLSLTLLENGPEQASAVIPTLTFKSRRSLL